MSIEKSVKEKVKDIIIEKLKINPEQITPEARFVKDLGADSLDRVEIIMALEEKFGIDISDEDTQSLSTVNKLISYIENHSQIDYFNSLS